MSIRIHMERFIFHEEPTAAKICELIWENNLGDYCLDIDREFTESVNGLSPFNKYKWVLTFRKRIT